MSFDRFSAFKGIAPAIDDGLTDYARRAHNVNLCHGRLDPWRSPLKKAEVPNAQSIHFRNETIYHAAECDACFADIEPCGDTIVSSRERCPAKLDGDCNATTLGFPCPQPPTATGKPDVSEGFFTELRSYAITYSNGCDEGGASAPSEGCKASKGDSITLTLPQPDPKYNDATEINIYRLQSSWDVSQGMLSSQPGVTEGGQALLDGLASVSTEADYYLVGTVPVGTTTFIDSGAWLDDPNLLCDTLVSQDYSPPPEGLCIEGLTALGSLVGYLGSELYFSERNTHYAWPDKYRVELGCEIRGICLHDNTIFVITDGTPFVLQDTPDALDTYCRFPQPADKAAPLASRKSLVCVDGVAIWATPDRLVAMTAQRDIRTISEPEFKPDNWRKICPESMRAACHDGDYFFSTNNFSGIFGNLLTEGDNQLTTIDICPKCWATDKSGALHFLKDGCVYQWDRGDEFLKMTYETSRQIGDTCNTVARIAHLTKRRDCSPCATLFEYVGDDCTLYQRHVDHNEIFNMCRRRTEDYRVRVSGYRSVRHIDVAPNRQCFRNQQ